MIQADPQKLPQILIATGTSESYLAIQFRQLSALTTDLQYNESTDLVHWTVVDPVVGQVGQPVDNSDGTETVILHGTVPLSGSQAQPKAFLKVEVQDITPEL